MFLMPAFMYVFNYSVKYVILFLFDSNRHITHWISVFRFSMRTFRSYLTEKNTRNNNFAFLTRSPRLAGSRKVRERGQDTPNDHFLQRFIFSPFPLPPSFIANVLARHSPPGRSALPVILQNMNNGKAIYVSRHYSAAATSSSCMCVKAAIKGIKHMITVSNKWF